MSVLACLSRDDISQRREISFSDNSNQGGVTFEEKAFQGTTFHHRVEIGTRRREVVFFLQVAKLGQPELLSPTKNSI